MLLYHYTNPGSNSQCELIHVSPSMKSPLITSLSQLIQTLPCGLIHVIPSEITLITSLSQLIQTLPCRLIHVIPSVKSPLITSLSQLIQPPSLAVVCMLKQLVYGLTCRSIL